MGLGASHCKEVSAPMEVSITTLSTAAVFSVVTVPGNLLIILSVLLDPNKNLRRTPYILLILNLAITDLIVGVMVEPLSMYIHWNEAHGLPINNSWLSQFVYFMCCTASLLSLAILTIDRYLAITSPLWYRANMTNARVLQRIHCYLGIVGMFQRLVLRHWFRRVRFCFRQLDANLHDVHFGVFLYPRVFGGEKEDQRIE